MEGTFWMFANLFWNNQGTRTLAEHVSRLQLWRIRKCDHVSNLRSYSQNRTRVDVGLLLPFSWRIMWETPASMRSWRQICQRRKWPNQLQPATCRWRHQEVSLSCSRMSLWLVRLVCRQMRKDYITAKYTEKRFARRKCTDAASRLRALYEAIRNRDILSLIQVYAEGVDLMDAIPQPNEHVWPPHL